LRIDITLGGALTRYLTETSSGNTMSFNGVAGSSLTQIIELLGIPEKTPLMAILNGDLIQPESYSTTCPADGDSLSLVPPIQAG
jgi:sulfur carrier protein ThiS